MKTRFLGALLSAITFCNAGVMLAAGGLDDPVCKIVIDAMTKSSKTPVHSYSTMGSIMDGTNPIEIETITIGDKAYARIGGQWQVSEVKPMVEEFMEQMTSQRAPISCEHERDEPFQGEAAAVYRVRLGEADGVIDSRLWVSKTRGLLLHTTADIPLNDAVTHVSVRYDYNNVKAPPVGPSDARNK
jgi:hypothetical protein